jgi:polyhydroxybutyrate depolymerase
MRTTGLLPLVLAAACGSSANGVVADAGAPPADAAATDAASPIDAAEAGSADARSTVDGAAPADGSLDAVESNDSGLRSSTLGGAPVPASAGCGATAGTGAQNISLTVDGATRTGVFYVPASYDASKAYPVVFVFHGDGGTGSAIRSSLDLEPDAAGKAIFAYPDGAGGTWNSATSGTNDDMAFVLAVRDMLRADYCVDTTRTFLTGMSRGGFFVNQLACRYGIAEFAGIAPHSSTIDPGDDNAYVYGPPNPNGGPYTEMGNFDFACPSDGTPYPSRPILPPPAFVIHGQCDTESGVEYAEGRRVVEHWGYAAQCSTTPAVAVTTSPDPTCAAPFTNNPTLTVDPCYVAPGCAAGHDITFCAIPGMDHQVWTDAHARIWSFFAAH